MRDTDYTSLRREFLSVGLTGAMVGLAGCSDSVTIETGSDDEDDGSTETPDIDTAGFSFSYDETAKQVQIEFTGGATIDAGNVQIRHDAGLEVLWAELGSTTAGPTEDIEAGSVAVLGPETLNWETPIEAGETIRLIYTGKETPATLERYSPPESTDSESTVPASISGFATTGTSDQQLRITFDSTKQLETLRVGVSGATSATLTRSDFTESGSSGNAYTYTATYTADADGSYTATLEQAIDIDGGNALNGENISDTAGINTEGQPSDTTPPSISAFSIANPSGREIRISFDSTEELNSIRVSISGPESVSLTATDFTQTAAAGDQISYESTYQAETDGEYTASLEEAIDNAGNDGANGVEVSVSIQDSSNSTGQTLIGDDFETDHNMEPYQVDSGSSENFDSGTTQADAPDGGSYIGWLRENDAGQGTNLVATSNETIDWNTSHEFNFLVRATEYSKNESWNRVVISWRVGPKSEQGEESASVKLSLFDTDGSGSPEPFRLGGGGVTNRESEHPIEWESNTWYNIKGYVDQETERAEAKIWEESDSEPDNYQTSVSISTESANDLPYTVAVDGRDGSSIRFEMAHLRWSEL